MFNQEISWIDLAYSSLLLLIPIFMFHYYKTRLVVPTLIAFGRMVGQLFLVGLYLEYIFLWDSAWINGVWIVVMIIAAAFMIVSRSELKKKYFLVPVIAAIVTNVLLNGSIFAFVVLSYDSLISARYLIPLMGMVIGNTLNATIIGIRSFFNGLIRDEARYNFYLMSGATPKEALFPFVSEALREAFNPVIASTAVIGLIWLPGMMAGQILGGQNPMIAIKYQILIVMTIFVGSVLTMFVSIFLAGGFAFDSYDRFDKRVLKDNIKKQFSKKDKTATQKSSTIAKQK